MACWFTRITRIPSILFFNHSHLNHSVYFAPTRFKLPHPKNQKDHSSASLPGQEVLQLILPFLNSQTLRVSPYTTSLMMQISFVNTPPISIGLFQAGVHGTQLIPKFIDLLQLAVGLSGLYGSGRTVMSHYGSLSYIGIRKMGTRNIPNIYEGPKESPKVDKYSVYKLIRKELNMFKNSTCRHMTTVSHHIPPFTYLARS